MGAVGIPEQGRALLLGLVEVTGPVKLLDEERRTKLLVMCHTASTESHQDHFGWMGRLERGIMGVQITMDHEHLHITSNEVLVSRYSLEEVYAITTVERAEGHLVFLGHCQVRGLCLAVVLDMMSPQDAQLLQDHVWQRLSQLGSASTRPSAAQNTASAGLTSRVSPVTTISHAQHHPSTIQSHRSDSSNTQPVNSTLARTTSPPVLRAETPTLRALGRPASRPTSLSGPPPLSAKPILPKTPAAVGLLRGKSPLVRMPGADKLTTTPLCLISRSPVSLVATRPVFTRHTSTPSVIAHPPVVNAPVSSPLVSIPKVSPRPVSIPKLFTQQLSIPTVSTPTVSTATVSPRPVSVPKVVTRPLSFPKVFTPLASIPPVSTSTVSTRPVSTPRVSIQPVSMTKISTPLVSVPKVSTSAVSSSKVSSSTTSINPVTTSRLAITLVSTTVVASKPVSASCFSVLPVSIMSSSVQNRRSSIASSNSQDEESNTNEKVELLLGALKVEESEYLYIPGMQPPHEQDSSTNAEQEFTNVLENERQYLNTLERIKEARKVLTFELQDLLRWSDRLFDFHDDLYQSLCQEFPSISGMAHLFLSHKEELDQYRYLIMNAPKVVSQLGQRTEEVVKQHSTLEADIKSSWKRIHFYFMTFERLLKIVPAEEQELVQKVVDLLRETNRQGDSGILIDAVSGAPFSLHTLGTLVLHTLFTIKDSSGVLSNRTKYHVLLFEEMMVILLPKKEKYQYKDHLPLRQLNLLTQSDSDKATFVLELVQGGNKRNRKYTFRPRQEEAKDVWVAEISRLHLKYQEEVERLHKLRSGYH